MKKFVASYSGGKDSILAIHRALDEGYQPVQLITTYNIDKRRSWFHGLTIPVIEAVSNSLEIPIRRIETTGELYAQNFEEALRQAKSIGADVCVFGDIDIEGHLQWCTDRCKNVGIEPYFPLWNQNRKDLVYELINHGYTARITIINTNLLNAKFLGKLLTHNLVDEIEQYGADACGENGEYHTFVSNGPIFKCPIKITYSDQILQDEYLILPTEVL